MSRIAESRKEFDQWAETYEEGFWSKYFSFSYRYVLRQTKSLINDSSNLHLVDIGCGTGLFLEMASKKLNCAQLIYVDISKKMLELARLKRTKVPSQFFSISSDKLSQIPANNDICYSLNSLHHFPDHGQFFSEAKKILKPGGLFVILDLTNDGFLRKIWIRFIRKHFNEIDVEFHSSSSLVKLVESKGFRLLAKKRFLYFLSYHAYINEL